ncbi:MAG: hypothetical protein VKP72_05800 [bacterium]|nr:hypothetical protein [bacterium]
MRLAIAPNPLEPRQRKGPPPGPSTNPVAARESSTQDVYTRGIRSQRLATVKHVLDWPGTVALERLDRSGALDGQRDPGGKPSLLEQLARLATAPLAPGLDRGRLMSDLVQQVADPGLIQQGDRGTCTVTTLEYSLARRDPAEYVRLVTGLASPSGRVKTAGGKDLVRVEDSLQDDRSSRTAASRLFEAAMMDLANGVVDYRNGADRHGFGPWTPFPGGLLSIQVARAATALTGKPHEAVEVVPLLGRVPFTNWGIDGLMKGLRETLARHGEAPVMLDWRGQGEKTHSEHMVLVLKIEGNRVIFRNPWGNTGLTGSTTNGKSSPVRTREASGGIESLSLEDFRKRLQGFIRPER